MRAPAGPTIQDGGEYNGVQFTRANLAGAAFRDVAFADCVFDHCALAGTVFTASWFTGCRFSTCDLSLAGFRGTRLMDVSVADSKLLGVNWTTVELPAKLGLSVQFERSVLDGSVFFGLNMRGVGFIDCSVRDADFANADLTDAVCTRTDFEGARFEGTTLVSADFRGATGYAINPTQNRVAKAKFSLPDAVALLNGLGVIID